MKIAGRMLAVTLVLIATFVSLSRATPAATPVAAQAAESKESDPAVAVEPKLLDQFRAGEQPGYLIYFEAAPDLSPAYGLDWEARGRYVMEALQAAADRSQARVRAYLDTAGVSYQPFWIDNVIAVDGSSQVTFDGLRAFSEIQIIRAERALQLIEPVDRQAASRDPQTVEPNLTHVEADAVWALGYQGEGSVVANIDTGARYTHEALLPQYRGNLGGGSYDHDYNWWDPYGDHPAQPADDNGHGSHTMGTMIGDDGGVNEIGMAPGASWIACRGCNTSSCGSTELLECAQWIAAPWDLAGANPDPDRRPYVVNNSWGDCDQAYDPWYQGVVDGWHAAGVYPVFSNGNASNCFYSAPPGLNTVGNPARYGNVSGVGSTGTSNGQYATHSNWGPTDNDDTVNPVIGWEDLKPQVLAPGVAIRSSINSGDAAYASYTGTSMSAPHVAGLIALMWQAAPCLVGDYASTETLIEQTANPIPYDDGTGGGAHVPNYATGWGEINALAAVEAAMSACGPSGVLEGSITDDATTDPIEDATVQATLNPTTTFQVTSNAAGFYQMTVPTGTYTLDVAAFGYLPANITGVDVFSGTTTTVDAALTPAPSYVVSGTVTDATTGWPLYARISIGGYPGPALWTDPVAGTYSLTLPAGITYTFTVEAWVTGYLPTVADVGPLTADTVVDFPLDVDAARCVAPGYSLSYAYSQDFEAADGGYTHTGTPSDYWQWGTPSTTWPGGCASGVNCWGTNLSGNYQNNANYELLSPVIDLSGESAPLTARWQQAWHIESATFDHGYAEVSINGGPWVGMWSHAGGTTTVDWTELTYDVSAAAGGNLQFRWRFTSDSSVSYEGLYVDDVTIAAGAACAPDPGGLVVGNVYDDNTAATLPGAAVANGAGEVTVAMTTPDDPDVDDAFYTLFTPAGSQVITATTTGGYLPDTATVTVVDGATQAQDFHLPAGWLTASPSPLSVTVELGDVATTTLNLDNAGGAPVAFEIRERDIGSAPTVQVGEDVLIVTADSTAAAAMEEALTTLGYSFAEMTDTDFGSAPVADLLSYSAVFHAGNTATASEAKIVAYLDAGGALYISDNDLGYFNSSEPFYVDYLQANYVSDDPGIDDLVGEAFMAGVTASISNDPFPDDFTVGSEGVRILRYDGGNAAGVAVDRLGYLAAYTSFDFDELDTANRVTVIDALYSFLVGGDVPWLSTDPITGTVSASSSLPVDVTFDAGVPSVSQPGAYYAQLNISEDTPYDRVVVPVTMTVTAPPSYGVITGTVSSLGYCDVNPFPAAGADVLIQATGGMTWTLTADDAGAYQLYLDESHSPITMTVSAPAHQTAVVSGVTIVGQTTTTQDFDLRWLVPCVAVNPAALSASLELGQSADLTVTIRNDGGAAAPFELVEADGGSDPLRVTASYPPLAVPYSDPFERAPEGKPAATLHAWGAGAPIPGNGRYRAAGTSCDGSSTYIFGGDNGSPTAEAFRYDPVADSWTPLASVPAALMNYQAACIDDMIYTVGGYTGSAHTNNFFVYNTLTDSWTASTWPNARTPMLAAYDGKLYAFGGNPGPSNETWVYDPATDAWSGPLAGMPTAATYGVAVTAGDAIYVLGGASAGALNTVQRYDPLANTWDTGGPPLQDARMSALGVAYGDMLYVVSGGGVGGDVWSPWSTTEVFDTTQWPGGSWSYDDENIPTPGVAMAGACAADQIWGAGGISGTSSTALNQFLDDGLTCNYGGEIPWLSEDPITGTVPADGGTVDVTVTMNAGAVSQAGLYYGALRVRTPDPDHPTVSLPVTMTVTAPPSFGRIAGTVSSLGYCDSHPAPAADADVTIQSSAGGEWALTTDAAGQYGIWVDALASPYTVTVAAAEHAGATVTVAVTTQMTTTQDFGLRWLQPCVTVAPTDLDVEVGLGGIITVPLSINNDGAGAAGFSILEAPALRVITTPAGDAAPGARSAPDRAGRSTPVYTPAPQAILLDEGFEGGVVPPSGWTRQVTNAGFTWRRMPSGSPHSGSEAADIEYDPGLTPQDEWLLSPSLILADGTLSFWSFGSLFWCRDTNDNCDLEVYLVVGSTAGDGDDIYVGTADADWTGDFVWSQSSFNLTPLLPAGPVRIGFRYTGVDGAQVALDDIVLDGTEGGQDVPWLSAAPTAGAVPADGATSVGVGFSAAAITQTGVYRAVLNVASDDPQTPTVPVPVTMTVTAVVADIDLAVTLSTDGSCGATDSLVVYAGTEVSFCYTVTNNGNVMLPNHTISDTVFGHIDTFVYELQPGMSESVIYTQTINADVTSTATWTASHAGLGVSAAASDVARIELQRIYLPFVIRPGS